ncbi:MAG TPA: hypothetical protein PLN83_01745 [Syntrophorhabdus sp.]|nr:hypothetical protein [Syntrophorhabdus sp.]
MKKKGLKIGWLAAYFVGFLSLMMLALVYGDPKVMIGEEISSREYSLVAYTAKTCPELRQKVVRHMSDGWIDHEEYDAIIREYCPGVKRNEDKDSQKIALAEILKEEAGESEKHEGYFYEF